MLLPDPSHLTPPPQRHTHSRTPHHYTSLSQVNISITNKTTKLLTKVRPVVVLLVCFYYTLCVCLGGFTPLSPNAPVMSGEELSRVQTSTSKSNSKLKPRSASSPKLSNFNHVVKTTRQLVSGDRLNVSCGSLSCNELGGASGLTCTGLSIRVNMHWIEHQG